jgi:hypothetical protein
METKLNDLAEQLKLLNVLVGGKVPASIITYGGVDSLGGGIKATATILSRNHPEGSEPADKAPIWEKLAGLGAGMSTKIRKDWYVQGHLLNHNLGGPGKRYNLTPITKDANNEHKSQVETGLKEAVTDQGKVVYYRVWVMEEWGSLGFPRLKTLKDKKDRGEYVPPREEREIEALQTLGKLARGFECEGYELEDKGGGKWGKKDGGYKVPNQTIHNRVKIGDKPYGY